MSPEKTIPATFKYVVTRKEYNCEGCGKLIPKTSRVLFVNGRIMGQWFREYWCRECDLDRIHSIPDQKLRIKLLGERI